MKEGHFYLMTHSRHMVKDQSDSNWIVSYKNNSEITINKNKEIHMFCFASYVLHTFILHKIIYIYIYTIRLWSGQVVCSCAQEISAIKPQSHCGDFWLQTNRNRHSLHIVHHYDSNNFLFVRWHFCIRLAKTAGQYDCFEMFKIFAGVLQIEAYSYCIMSILVGSYVIFVHSYQFILDLHQSMLLSWCNSIQKNKMCNDHIQTNKKWDGVDTMYNGAVGMCGLN